MSTNPPIQAPKASPEPPVPGPPKTAPGKHAAGIILFDGVCNLCNGFVDFVIRRDPEGRFAFGSLQSEEATRELARVGASTNLPDSVVLIEDGTLYTQSDAALRVASQLGLPWSLFGAFRVLPKGLRDAVYNFIAARRYRWFGKRDTCRLPTPEERARFL